MALPNQQRRYDLIKMAPNSLSEDEIDDLLYFARTGDAEEFRALKEELLTRDTCGLAQVLKAARDADSGNGVLHMAAANGHEGKAFSSAVIRCIRKCLQWRSSRLHGLHLDWPNFPTPSFPERNLQRTVVSDSSISHHAGNPQCAK